MKQSMTIAQLKDEILRMLYVATQMQEAVSAVLEMVGQYFNVSRAYIFENSEDDLLCSNTFEWCNHGIAPQIADLQELRYLEDLGGVYDQNFDENGVFFCGDIHALPPEQQALLKPQGIQAMLQCAIRSGGQFKGCIGFDDCETVMQDWEQEPEAVETLTFTARILALYLLERRNGERLQNKTRQLEEALKRANVANLEKTNFISRISHDMRTPMNAVLSLSQMAVEENPEQETCLEYMSMIHSSGVYLLNLINDVLDIQKAESGNMEISPRPTDAGELFQGILTQMRPLIEQKNIHFNMQVLGFAQNVRALIDPLRYQQIMLNLLGNAVKFTPAGGQIDLIVENISIKDNLAHDRITIRDSGVGMTPDFMRTMYEPFTQENNGKDGLTQGTGLGLAITKRLVELMGGTISCTSEIGKGTTFVLETYSQLLLEDKEHPPKPAPLPPDLSVLSGKHVLLFEDHEVNARIAQKLLCKQQMLVDIAENGDIGLKSFTQSPIGYYDAILMDVRMPVMDGLTATRHLRALDRPDAAQIPIVALSANAFETDVQESLAAGMNAHLAKPIHAQTLYTVLADCLLGKQGRNA